MKIKLIRAYSCAPEGHSVIRFEAGAIITGRAAEMALADGAGLEAGIPEPLETKITPPDETKAPAKPRVKGKKV